MKILLAIIFVYGVIHLLTNTKLFATRNGHFFNACLGVENKNNAFIGGLLLLLDIWFYYFSLVFQSWYWLFK